MHPFIYAPAVSAVFLLFERHVVCDLAAAMELLWSQRVLCWKFANFPAGSCLVSNSPQSH